MEGKKQNRNNRIVLYVDNRDSIETFSYLLSLLKKGNIGKMKRNKLSMDFIHSMDYRGTQNKFQVFNDIKKTLKDLTGIELIVRRNKNGE
jgi:hypothetical protein